MSDRPVHGLPDEAMAEERGLLSRWLGHTTDWVCANPGLTLGLTVLLCLLSVGISSRFLRFKTDRADLIHPDAEFHRRWLRYTEKFGDQTEVLIVVEGDSRAQIQAALDDVGHALEAEPELFERVMYRFDPAGLQAKALQYLSPQELETILGQLTAYGPILEGNWDAAGIQSHADQLALGVNFLNQAQAEFAANGLSSADVPPDLMSPQQAQQLEAATLLFSQSLNRFQGSPETFVPPWPQTISADTQRSLQDFSPKYQINPAGTMGFVVAALVAGDQDFGGASKSLNRLRTLVSEYDAKHPEVHIGLTGIPVLESDEMQRSQQDMSWATLISFAGVALLMLIGCRGYRHPFMAMLTLAVGLLWSLGYCTLAVGHLNILSVSFAAILMGLGIDFSIHYLAKYLEFRHHGGELQPSLKATAMTIGTGIFAAAVTTTLAFSSASFTSFLGVAELGIIAGGGVLICAVATFLVLPALISYGDRNLEPRRLPTPFAGNFIRFLTRRYPGLVSGISLAVIVVIGCQGLQIQDRQLTSRVTYDSNLLHLQAQGVPSVELQERLFEQSEGSLLFAVSLADSSEQVRQLRTQFQDLDSVGRVEDLALYLPAYPPAETQLLVQAIAARLARLSDLPGQFPQLDPEAIGQSLERLYVALKDRPEPWAKTATAELDAYLDRLTAAEFPQQTVMLQAYQQGMLMSLHRQFTLLSGMSTAAPVSPEDFPESVRGRFLSSQGDWLLRVYPKEQVWDEAPLSRFVADVRSVDPDVTGTPLQNYEAARQIRSSYLNATVYALGAIVVTLLIDIMAGAPLVLTLLSPFVVICFAMFTMEGSASVHPIWWVGGYTLLAVLVAAIFDLRSLRNTVLALSPPVLGLFLMFGIMGMLGMHLNPANMIVLPLILGIGVDNGVHMIHDFRHQRGPYRTSGSTINGLMMTSLTTMVGFGSMLVAAHQGLVTLGLVLVIGVGASLFVSLVTLPALLTLIGTGNPAGESEQESPQSGPTDSTLTGEEDQPHLLPLSLGRGSSGAA